MQAKLGYSAYGGVFCPTRFLSLPAIFTICRVVCMHPAPSLMHPGYFLNGTVYITSKYAIGKDIKFPRI